MDEATRIVVALALLAGGLGAAGAFAGADDGGSQLASEPVENEDEQPTQKTYEWREDMILSLSTVPPTTVIEGEIEVPRLESGELTLTWENPHHDLDLSVQTPEGAETYSALPGSTRIEAELPTLSAGAYTFRGEAPAIVSEDAIVLTADVTYAGPSGGVGSS